MSCNECCREIECLRDSEEMAWVLIANAYGGNWDLASKEWRDAAERWRDAYIAELPTPPKTVEQPTPNTLEKL